MVWQKINSILISYNFFNITTNFMPIQTLSSLTLMLLVVSEEKFLLLHLVVWLVSYLEWRFYFSLQRLSGASLLIFANKQDIQGSLSPDAIAKVMHLAYNPWCIHPHCFVIECFFFSYRKLRSGFSFLLLVLESHFDSHRPQSIEYINGNRSEDWFSFLKKQIYT